jgi:4-diphosphocytidyl-2-C-methyl-D-erythritol kinase
VTDGPAPENRAQRSRAAAPAKINLGLRVVGQRADGYHELESVFLPLDLADDVILEWSAGPLARVALSLDFAPEFPAAEVPGGPGNLAVRAAQAFLDRTRLALDVQIRLTKRIPAAAGLGGGSSDAGAVLRLLAAACPDALDARSLAALALALGADVPFFLDPQPAFVRGVGERIEPLAGWPELHLLLLNPGVPLATAEVFRAADALRPPRAAGPGVPDLRERAEGVIREPAGGLGGLVYNDLEAAAVRLCPPVARLRQRLGALGASAVGLSGSGPTVYGAFPTAEAARAALARLAPEPPLWARVAVAAKPG